ncbi:hypothetical protein [Methyloprofundus sp.]|uniref:hypothetical protein n=1 Tax=Methyloprofundus sp. TaxID=2020875 RepID=UPI003D0ED1AF
MNLKALKNTEELQSFLEGSQAVAFSLPGKENQKGQSRLKQKEQKGSVSIEITCFNASSWLY